MSAFQGKISFRRNLIISALAIILSLLTAAIIMLVFGYNPIEAYAAMLDGAFGNPTAFANTLSKATPLLFCGLSFAFANKAGVFNIGGEGQLYLGALAATVVALAMQGMPKILVVLCAFFAALLAGGLLGVILGVSKAKLGLSEVIVAIMLNYIVTLFCSWAVNGPLKPEGSMTAQTEMIADNYLFSKLAANSQLSTSFIVAILFAVALYLLFKKTRQGFNTIVVGANLGAAKASGIDVNKTMLLAMTIAGGIAGIGGMMEVFGVYGRFIEGFSPGYGFTGIAVSVLGANNPFGIILTSILFGAMDAGAMKMSYSAGISANMVNVIQGLVIVFVASPSIALRLSQINKKKIKKEVK